MKIQGKILRGVFQSRPNRFLTLVRVKGSVVPCFLPNPGRLKELLLQGAPVLIREKWSQARMPVAPRKTRYDLIAVDHAGQRVFLDTRMPNQLVAEALEKGSLEEFRGYEKIVKEFPYGRSRFDFALFGNGKKTTGNPPAEPFLLAHPSAREADVLLEVKSCTLVENGRGLFPDAVTERGKRHLLELTEAKRKGYRASLLFVVQRTDALSVSPNDRTDPEFGKALRKAKRAGVEIYAYFARWKNRTLWLEGKVPVELQIPNSPSQGFAPP